MSLLAWIVLFTLLGGVLSVLAAALFLLLPESQRTRALPAMVSFAIGALLGAAFLAVLPHALAAPGLRDMHAVTTTVLLGLLGFFLLEKLVLWRHCHIHECETHAPDPVREAVVSWIRSGRRARRKLELLDAWVETQIEVVERSEPRAVRISTRGRVHDLEALGAQLRAGEFAREFANVSAGDAQVVSCRARTVRSARIIGAGS